MTSVVFKLTQQKYRKLGENQDFCFQKVEEVVKLRNCYFNEFETKLKTVPNFDQITDNLFYKTNADGSFQGSAVTLGYDGEVKLFSERFLPHLQTTAGLMLKNYSNDQLSTVLCNSKEPIPEFEIDWFYLGKQIFVPIEVGCLETNKTRTHQSSKK